MFYKPAFYLLIEEVPQEEKDLKIGFTGNYIILSLAQG